MASQVVKTWVKSKAKSNGGNVCLSEIMMSMWEETKLEKKDNVKEVNCA